MDNLNNNSKREHIFDFLRSVFMLFVFLHHFYLTNGNTDYFEIFNPFAELFVGLAGFMVGMIYLYRKKDIYLLKRGLKILLAYYLVSIPFTIAEAVFINNSNRPVYEIFFNVVFMLEDTTEISILRFYGLIFIMLPIILWIYRRLQIGTIIISVLIFFFSSIVFYHSSYQDNFFVSKTLMMILQWQLFFIIGLTLGDLYKKEKFLKLLPTFRNCYVIIAPICLFIHVIWFSDSIIKFPYSYGKLLNTLYLLPIYLGFFCYLYKKNRGGVTDRFIRVVGRNSLVAFVLSEIIRTLLIRVPTYYFNLELTEFNNFLVAIFMSFLLICIIWIYEKYKKQGKFNLNVQKTKVGLDNN